MKPRPPIVSRDSTDGSKSASAKTQHSAALGEDKLACQAVAREASGGWMDRITNRNAAHTVSANELTSHGVVADWPRG